MALSLLHQTVNNTGLTFTPDLTVNGWFTLHWYDDQPLNINAPTALLGLANGQEFVIDIVRHRTAAEDTGHRVSWANEYMPANRFGDETTGGPNTFLYPWTGGAEGPFQPLARRLFFFWLGGVATMRSMTPLVDL